MAEGPGQLIAGQYRLAEEIGRGGFGVVWRARDERLHRDVAAKELFLPTYLEEDQRQERRSRSLREARSAARIVHPAAVTVYDVVEHDGCPWIIMELIDGRALNAIVKTDGPLTPIRAAEIGLEILGALQAAHAAGVVHRDVKPGNVLINDRRVVLTDFGIATIEGDPTLTHSGFVMGAPAYTAPERARGEHAIPASDLWSLGATLFYAVEGHRPYPGPNANAVFHAILNGDPARPRHAGALTPIIEGLLRKEIKDRLTATEAATQLRRFLEAPDQPVSETDETSHYAPPGRVDRTHPSAHRLSGRRRRRALIAATAVTTALALSLGAFFWPDAPRGQAERNHLSALAPLPGGLLTTLGQRSAAAFSVGFSPDGRTLAVGDGYGKVEIWDTRSRKLVKSLRGDVASIFDLDFSPDGKILATGGYSGTVHLWSTAKWNSLKVFRGNRSGVRSLDFAADSRSFVSADSTSVQIWDVQRRKLAKTVVKEGDEEFLTAIYGQNKSLVTTGTDALRLWPAAKGDESIDLAPANGLINDMAFSPDGKLLATASQNGWIEIWDVPQRRRRTTLIGNGMEVKAVTFCSQGTLLAAAAGRDVLIWSTAAHRKLPPLTGHSASINGIACSNGVLASAADDRTVRLWKLGAGG